MKQSIISLIFLWVLTAQATSVIDYEGILLPNGSIAYCESIQDVSSTKYGAYNAKVKKVEVRNNDFLDVKIDFMFFECKELDGKFGFIYKNPYSPFKFKQLDYQGNLNEVLVKPLDVSLKGYVDGVYRILLDKKITNNNQAKTSLSFSVALNDLITNKEKVTQEGDSYIVDIDLFLARKMKWDLINKDFKEVINTLNYGSFRIRVKIKQGKNFLSASLN